MGLTQVTGKGITDGTIFNVDVHASAAIAGSKINPAFTSDVTITEATPRLTLVDSDNSFSSFLDGGSGNLFLNSYNTNRDVIITSDNLSNEIARFTGDGNLGIANNSPSEKLDVTGNIAVSGTVDGRDLATDGTKLDGIESNATADQTASEIVALIADQTIAPSTIDMEDNEEIRIGDSDDLKIFHNGSHSRFLDNGAGKIQFGSDTGVEVLTANFATQIALFDSTQILLKENTSITGNLAVSGTISGTLANGVVATTQSAGDNSTKVATTAYTDTAIANLADSAPSTLNTLNELAAALGDDANFSTTVTNSIATKLANIVEDTSPELGGDLQSNGSNIKLGDSSSSNDDRLQIGAATYGDLELYHDGTHSYIDNATNDLYIRNTGDDIIMSAADDIVLQVQGSETGLRCNGNGAVEAYYDNTKKFETTSLGATVYGRLDVAGLFSGDNNKILVGNSNDLQIFHDGNHSFLQNSGTGDLIIYGTGEDLAKFKDDGAVELYFDNFKAFQTTTHGVQVNDNDGSVQIDMVDNAGITGYVYGAGTNFGLLDKSGNWKVKVAENAMTELYFHTTKRLETTNSGVNVVGALTINGAALGGGNPTGTVISYAGSSAPTGYLKANGDSIPNGSGTVQGVTEDFSDLYAVVGSSLPDLRGEFVRGLDDGRGVDSGRSIRSSQGNQNLSHSHTTNSTLEPSNNNSKDLQGQFNGEERDGRPFGVFYTVGGRGRDFDGGDGDYIGFDGRHRHGTTSNGGSEARPRNVALLMCIKY